MSRAGSGARALAVAVAAVVLIACLAAAASAAPASNAKQRTAVAQAIARYEQALSTTGVGQAQADMRTEERRLDPCVPDLKAVYVKQRNSGHRLTGPAGIAYIADAILAQGAHATGEPWYVRAAFPVDVAVSTIADNGNASEAERYMAASVTPMTQLDICAPITHWAGAGYPVNPALRPQAFDDLMRADGVSPVLFIGTRPARTFTRWGFGKRLAEQLTGELSQADRAYRKLDAAAARQFIDWLKRQGLYQVMRAGDRTAMTF